MANEWDGELDSDPEQRNNMWNDKELDAHCGVAKTNNWGNWRWQKTLEEMNTLSSFLKLLFAGSKHHGLVLGALPSANDVIVWPWYDSGVQLIEPYVDLLEIRIAH